MRALRTLVRDLSGELLFRLGVTRPGRAAAGRLVVVMFHRILPREHLAEYPLPELVVTPEELAWFAGFFARHFTCTTVTDGLHRLRAGERPARPLLCVTFDDGQVDNFEHGRPALASAGVPATFFAVAGVVGRAEPLWHDRIAYAVARAVRGEGGAAARGTLARLGISASIDVLSAAAEALSAAARLGESASVAWAEELEVALGGPAAPHWDGMMTAGQLRALRAEGHEIGSHSLSHPNLTKCDGDRLEAEARQSKQRLEALIDAEVTVFCYPGGAHDDRVVERVRAAGYAAAVTTNWGLNSGTVDPFRLRRCDMHGSFARVAWGGLSSSRLAFRLSGLHPGLRA